MQHCGMTGRHIFGIQSDSQLAAGGRETVCFHRQYGKLAMTNFKSSH